MLRYSRCSFAANKPVALVFGSGGAMGASVANTFQQKGWRTVGIDVTLKHPDTTNIALPAGLTASEEMKLTIAGILGQLQLAEGEKFAAIVNAAGGWAGGGASSSDIAASTELMWNQSVRSSILCSHIATNTKLTQDDLLLVLTGAAAAKGPTSGMLAYGTAKAAVHHITRSVAEELAASSTPKKSAVCVCPVTIDTPGNRAGMPDADFSSWTPLTDLSGKIFEWASNSESRPKNGELLEVATKGGKTSWKPL